MMRWVEGGLAERGELQLVALALESAEAHDQRFGATAEAASALPDVPAEEKLRRERDNAVLFPAAP